MALTTRIPVKSIHRAILAARFPSQKQESLWLQERESARQGQLRQNPVQAQSASHAMLQCHVENQSSIHQAIQALQWFQFLFIASCISFSFVLVYFGLMWSIYVLFMIVYDSVCHFTRVSVFFCVFCLVCCSMMFYAILWCLTMFYLLRN